MVLVDPDTPGAEIVYLALYDRALAVRTDGTVVWDVPTGLTVGPTPLGYLVLGLNYVPAADALVALTGDGHRRARPCHRRVAPGTAVRASDRPRRRIVEPPPAIVAAADAEFRNWSSARDAADLHRGPARQRHARRTVLGRPTTSQSGAATAPDGEDGTVDGVSQLGALFRLGLVAGTAGYQIQEVCHRSFSGGSASTPTISADGARVYLGDNTSLLLAVDTTCADLWSVDVGAQIFGSVAASSDKREIYTSTRLGITKVVDHGASATVEWTANLDVFDLAMGQQNLNMNLVAIGANGLAFQAGAGTVANGTALPDPSAPASPTARPVPCAACRRRQETVAVMSTGPDGAVYLGNSPVRRIFPGPRPLHRAAGWRHHQVRLRRSAAPDARRCLRRRGAGSQRRRPERLRRGHPCRRRPDRRPDRPGARAVGRGDRRRPPQRHPVGPPRPPPHPRRALSGHCRRGPHRDARPQARRQPHRPRLPQARSLTGHLSTSGTRSRRSPPMPQLARIARREGLMPSPAEL
jgi:hypothetical protein